MKKLRQLFLTTAFLLVIGLVLGQRIEILTSGKPVSLRGLSVVNDEILWVSGSAGSVGLSTDGGKNWKWIQVPRYEKTDFRDIEAFNDHEAVIMGITEPAVILKTTDGGRNWTTVFEDSSRDVFLDALAFSGDLGIVIGDPIQHKMVLAVSENRGGSWNRISASEATGKNSKADSLGTGETFFAASGSNFQPLPGDEWAGVTGGKKSTLLLSSGEYYTLLMNQGGETTGANSIAINPANSNEAFVVGGDFSHDSSRYMNALHIQLDPFVQTAPQTAPHGYRSCVEYLDNNRLVCCGTSGVDFSEDGGINWKLISGKSFHVCRRSGSGRTIFLAGAHGSIARLDSVTSQPAK
jgi:hypothetical protein